MNVASASLPRDLRHIYEAQDLPQMRKRLGDALQDRGFSIVSEFKIALQVDRSFFDLSRFVWDNIEQRFGARQDELRRDLFETAAGRRHGDATQRLPWRAAQKRPYLTLSGAAARFPTHRDVLNAYADFGMAAVNTLVVPLPRESAGHHFVFAVVERASDLRNVPDAVALISVYYLASRLRAAGNDNHRSDDQTPSRSGERISLGARQQSVLRWAAAGKTHQDIADILGMPVRTVRYQIDRARQCYGYATAQQTIVRAALDYGFDPLGRTTTHHVTRSSNLARQQQGAEGREQRAHGKR